MAIKSNDHHTGNMFTWVYEKGKQLFKNTLLRDVESDTTPVLTKKPAVIVPKTSNEPIKWPLPTKK